jgi:ABC-2 type transport system permease protein
MEAYARAGWLIDYARTVNVDSVADALYTYIIGAMAIVIAMYAIMTALRLRSEETGGGAETVLAEPVTRRRWMASHLAFAVGAPVLILAALGIGLGVGSGINNGGGIHDMGGELAHMLSLTVPLSPAVWVITGITAAAFGLLPRAATVVGWVGLATGIGVEIAVKASILPEWVFLTVSPFSHLSSYFRPSLVDYLVLTLLAAGLIAVGTAAFNRRDLTT